MKKRILSLLFSVGMVFTISACPEAYANWLIEAREFGFEDFNEADQAYGWWVILSCDQEDEDNN